MLKAPNPEGHQPLPKALKSPHTDFSPSTLKSQVSWTSNPKADLVPPATPIGTLISDGAVLLLMPRRAGVRNLPVTDQTTD